ncbi:hypothetical protein EB796_021723 [Bugula neritina]|uniref:Nudix hydrolase domain-containing protein n=1 Tax=Bugula neritina TaxID=10212 RepID=A0A7J7J2T9_BUGNE|nr:hypothetical protein EB796_021723 [Bugula neritina]
MLKKVWSVCKHLSKNLKLINRPSQLTTSILSARFSTQMAENASSTSAVFVEKQDRFKCVVLDLGKDCHVCADDQFKEKMTRSIDSWKSDGVRAITTFIPSSLSHRIPTLLDLGFDFHHANPGYVLMLRWLSETDTNNFPAYANHYVGVSGFVVNEHDEVLVIQERFTSGKMVWKFPGGGADTGEHIAETAQREVFEETGIKSKFLGILAFRHMHGFRYGCSDFYFSCLMKAESNVIKKCDQEISKCAWIKLSELEKEDLYPTNRFILNAYNQYLSSKGTLIQLNSIPNYTNTGFHTAYCAGQVSPSPTQSSCL